MTNKISPSKRRFKKNEKEKENFFNWIDEELEHIIKNKGKKY